jgi:hypothetical protein
MTIPASHHLLTEAFGPQCGMNAAWSVPTWCVAGYPQDSGIHIHEDVDPESQNVFHLCVHRFDEEGDGPESTAEVMTGSAEEIIAFGKILQIQNRDERRVALHEHAGKNKQISS